LENNWKKGGEKIKIKIKIKMNEVREVRSGIFLEI